MKILLTGANGLLGTATAAQLAKDHHVVALVRALPSQPIAGIQYLQHDLTQPLLPLYAQIDHLDAIIHTAQSRLYRDFPRAAQDIFAINVHATLNLIEIGLHFNIKHFIYTSTGTVYEPFINHLAEDLPVDPHSFYGVTKFLSEKLLACYQSMFNVLVFRLFFLYGNQPNGSLIATLINKVRNEEPITLAGETGFTLTPTHVLDVATLLEHGLTANWTGIVNVASPEHLTLKDIVLKISQKLDLPAVWLAQPEQQPPCIIPSLAKLHALHPKMKFIPLEQGLDHLLSLSSQHA